jgi:aminoglycoside phosphotransferase family enzyme/predicted kinase
MATSPQVKLDAELERWLLQGAGATAACERVIETSISWVFLYPDKALKLKKPVDFGFLDFTAPEKRRWAAGRELEFNRVTAPGIYRAVRAIVRRKDGGFALDGEGEVVDWALEMRRFDEKAVLSEQPSVVQGDFAEGLGRLIARMHGSAAPGRRGGGSAGLGEVAASNACQLRSLSGALGRDEVERVIAATDAALDACSPLLDRRLAAGLVRRCHGDLHLGNILLEDGQPVLFDCIEFNDALSEIDVLYDLSFLLMDLGFRGQAGGANRVLNGWLDEAARSFGDTQWAGLGCLELFQSIRAAVRSHVCAHAGDLVMARRYLAAAEAHLQPASPVLVAVGGLSGSGKSTLARALASELPPCPGAVVLRTDEIRKRLWRRAPTDRLPPEAYSREASEAVYATMLEVAAACLAARWPVILDAVFLHPRERAATEALASRAEVRFAGIWLDASPDILRARVAGRRDDASDADLKVLEGQLARDPGHIAWTRRDARNLNAAIRGTLPDLAAPRRA